MISKTIGYNGVLTIFRQTHVAIDEQETTPLHLADGDYFKIFIGEIDYPEVCLSDVESKRCKHITMDFRGQWVYPY